LKKVLLFIAVNHTFASPQADTTRLLSSTLFDLPFPNNILYRINVL